MRHLQHSARTDPVAGQVDAVEDDTEGHGDGEQGEVAPPGVVERVAGGEVEGDATRSPALQSRPWSVVEQ